MEKHMAAQVACFDAEVLTKFLKGTLAGSEVASLEQHLLQCDRCAETVNALVNRDTLVEAMQAPATVAEEPESDVVRGLIERLRRLRPAAESLGEASTVDPAQAQGSGIRGQIR